ncbi:MAG: FAD:protein FMN transferase, partial [Sulfurimonadaceae bacterium]
MQKFIYKFEAMSTPCELILYADEKTKADSGAEAVLLEAKRLEKKYNYYRADSLLSQINDRSVQELDAESKQILQRAKQYYTLTDGIFDITVATIKELYKTEEMLEALEAKKAALLPYIGCEHFTIKRDKILFDNPYTKIDLGGFVKEYAVDRAVQLLKKRKFSTALINFGGDIYAIGKKPDGKKFMIGIKDPQDPKRYAMEVALEDQALTTSASYERNYTVETQTFSHIIAKTEPASKAQSVSVISHSCVESGIYST